MAYGHHKNGLRRRDAIGMDELVEEFIRDMKLTAGLNRQRVKEAWNTVSGAGRYTIDVYVKDKVMYCTIGSSMARNQLYFQRDVLRTRVNEFLANDELFVKSPGTEAVRSIVLK